MRRIVALLLCMFAWGIVHSQAITPAGPTGFCPGGFVTLTISGAPAGSTYKWYRDGSLIAGTSTTYAANIAGTYNAVVSSAGNPDTTLNNVVVVAYPQPVADFTFDNNNTCSGTQIQFTSTVTTGTAPFTYTWDFGDGTQSSSDQNPIHAFTSLGCGTGNFTVRLTVTDANGCKSTVVTKIITVKQVPDIRLQDTDIFTPFSNCDKNPNPNNPTFTLTIANSSVSNCIAPGTYILDWGDGSPVVNNPAFPLTHTYTQLGAYNLVFTATGTNGCTYSKTYVVANQSNPAGGLGTLGATTGLCAPWTIPFIISNWENNSPGTKYILDFGDNTSVTLSHPLANDTVYHQYANTSCPGNSTFTARLRVVNACDSTPYTAGNIQIRIRPAAAFVSANSVCVNRSICFTNTTTAGYTGSTCSPISAWSWDFGDGSPSSTATNPCHVYTTPGIYTVTLSSTNPCGTTTFSKQICVTGTATPSFTLDRAEGCAPQTITVTNTSIPGSPCVQPTYKWTVTYSSTNCGTGSGWTFTNATRDTSTNPSFVFSNPGTYTITLAVSNACGTVTTSKTVVIKRPPTVTLPAVPNACSSVTFNPSTGTFITNCGSGTLTYLWTFTGGTPATSTSADPGLVTFNSPGTNSITLAVTNECGTTTATRTFGIDPAPDLTVPANVTICGGQTAGPYTFTSATSGTTFSWTNNNTAIGLSASGSGNTIPAFIPVNNTASPTVATITVNATKGGCPTTQSFTITVNPRPAKPAVVRPVVYCLNETPSPLSAAASPGNTLSWYTTYPGTGSATPLTPSTAAAGSTTYYVTQSNSFNCESDTARILVIVNPLIANNAIGSDQTICNGSSAQTLTSQGTISGGSGTYTYQWQQSTDGGTTWTNIAGATTATYNPGAVSADTRYRRVVNSATCSDTSNFVTITVQGSLTNAGISAPQTICEGTQPARLQGQTPTGGNGSFTYEWEVSANNTSWSTIAGATAADYQPPVLTATRYYRRKVSSGQCSVYSSSVEITVNPRPVIPAIADKFLCHNTPLGPVAFTSAPVAASYSWTNDNTAIALAASGTGNISSFTATNTSTPKVPVTANIKVVGIFTQNNVSCTGDTTAFRIVVLPAIALAPIPNEEKCTGQTVPAYVPLPDTGSFEGISVQYSWTVSGSGITLINGTGAQIPAYTTANPGSTNMVATITVTPKYTYAGRTCDGVPASYTVTVRPATANANAGIDQVLCAATTTSLSATFVNGTTGAWSEVGTTGTVITAPASNITTVTGLVPGTVYKFVWTQTGFATCPATTDTVVIDNKFLLANKIDATTKTICAGNGITIAGQPATGGGNNYSYQWEQSSDGISFTPVTTQTLQNITITPTATVWLRRFVNAAPCSGYSDTVKVNVQPALANNSLAASQTICTGTSAQTIDGSLPTGGNNVFTYQWQQSINGGATWTAISGANGEDYLPGILTQTTLYRRIVSTDLCSGLFGSTSNVITVAVNPDAKALFLPADTLRCPPFVISQSVINLQPSTANGQYQWYANGVLIGNGTTFPGYTIANENDSVIIKLKVISTFGCKNDSIEQKFKTVKRPTPLFTLSDTVGCGPITVTATNTSTYLNEYTYFWDFGNGQTSTAIQPQAITFAPNPNYGDTTYVVTLKVFSPCDTLTFTRSIRVKSKPKALFTPAKTIGCSPMTVNFKNTSKGANNTYFWDFGDGTTVSTAAPDSVQHTFITGVVDTFYVKLRVENECGKDSLTYSIIVAPNTIKLNLAVNGTDRFGCQPHTASFINNSQGAAVFHWNFGDGAITTTTENLDTIRHTYLTPGSYTVTLRAINNCSDTSTTETIVVYPKPRASFAANKYTICIGDTLRLANTSDSATAYLWKFGNGLTSTLANPIHIYSTPGSYTITLVTYRDNASGNVCVDSTKQTVTVTTTQAGFFTISDSAGLCAPFTVTLANQNKPSVTTTWDLGDGTTATGDNVVHTYQTAGTYVVRLTATVPGGCTYITSRTVTVAGPKGTLQYTGGIVCHPSAVRFQAVATGASNYVWDFGDGTVISTTQQTIFHTYANPGFYLPKVTLQNGACNILLQGTDTIKVDKVDGGFTFAKNEICGSTTLTFTDTSHVFAGIQSIRWKFGDNTTGTGASPSHVYTATGRYTVEMIITSKSGCTDTVTQQIDVLVKSIPVVSINAADTGCTRRSIAFNALVQTVDAINLIQWNLSNGANGTGPVFNYTFAQPGKYDVRLVVGTVNGCYDTAFHTITVNPSPVVTASSSLDLCRGNTVQLNVIGAATWQWLPLSGLSCYTCPAPLAAPTITTPYIVEGKNSFGCADYDTVVITVIQPLRMNVSPNDSICTGQTTNLSASGASSYSWSPAMGLNNTTISNPAASPTVTTTYRVVGYDGYNCFTDTAFVTVGIGQYPTVNLGPDLTLATGTLHPLTSTITNGPIRNWVWSPATNLTCVSCPQPIAEIKKDITYTVRVTTPYGCSATDTVSIKVFCKDGQVFVPNAFTPDGDGLNDKLMVRASGIVSVKYFRIFNRWGDLIFERDNFRPNDPLYGWDGKVRGVISGPDVFVYTCEVLCENGTSFVYKGNVSIIK